MAGRARGKFTTQMVSIQSTIPQEIAKAVFDKAEEECLSASTYYRRWIIEGFKKGQAKGDFK